ncbi:MAG: DNA primase [Clostridia bacterium]|nr:DNA primase [Clostridia bacterium]
MMISQQVIDEIKARNDIVDLVSQYVHLKRAGSNMLGLCPFHSEKTPSFTVFTARQGYYCFGCGAGGDVITFVRQIENLEYVPALEFLAKRAGITIPADMSAKKDGFDRARMFEMNKEAARFFRDCLFDKDRGKEGMAYLRKRGLSDAVIKHFGLGFAPPSFGLLTDYLHGRGYTDKEMTAGFLCGISKKNGRPFDYFRNRVMFPILDVSGNVIAFGGRVLDDSTPKYLNSSDTPVFKKSRNLFALNFARGVCANEMILCEGYMDVIALHAAGFCNAVATLGTALTPEQARIMSRYTKKVVISYDSDAAGQKAANRAIGILSEVGLDVRVLKIEGAKDPDEFIKSFGAENFAKQLAGSRGKFEYNFDNILAKYNVAIPDEKIKALAELCKVVSEIYSSAEREVYIGAIAKKLDVPAESIKADVARLQRKQKKERDKQNAGELLRKSAGYGDAVNPDYAKNVAAAKAEETILGLLLLYAEHREAVQNGSVKLEEADFFSDFGKRVFSAIMSASAGGTFDASALGDAFSPAEQGRLMRMQLARENLTDNGLDVLRDSIERLRRASRKSDEENPMDGLLDIISKKRNQ